MPMPMAGPSTSPDFIAPSFVLAATPAPPAFRALRAFVASETTDSVWVLEGGERFTVVGRIAVGKMPHNLAVSPDAKWIAVANRMGNSVSILDPYGLVDVARVPVGRQPHDITWAPDSGTIFVGHERDNFITRIEAGTWLALRPLMVGVPQHDLAISHTRPNDLFFTVTNSNEADHLRVYDLESGAITKFKVQDVHDVFYTPDGSELWTTSSGFINVSSDRIVVHDPATRTVKAEFHFAGRYPFHTMKEGRDGAFFPPAGTPMLLSDHGGPSLLYVDAVARRIVGETRVGLQPFHTTYDPLLDRLLVTSNADDSVRVIDLRTRAVTQTIAVTKAHGIVAVGLR